MQAFRSEDDTDLRLKKRRHPEAGRISIQTGRERNGAEQCKRAGPEAMNQKEEEQGRELLEEERTGEKSAQMTVSRDRERGFL